MLRKYNMFKQPLEVTKTKKMAACHVRETGTTFLVTALRLILETPSIHAK